MWRERALKVVLVVVGLLFSATIYPLMRSSSFWQPNQSEDIEPMMLSLYVTLGIFLLIAAQNPSANRSLIAFTAWLSIVHATVMTVQAFQNASNRGGLLGAAATFVVIGVAPDRAGSGEAIIRARISSADPDSLILKQANNA
jgi:hypothetical protein